MFAEFKDLFEFLHDPVTGMYAVLALWLIWKIVQVLMGKGDANSDHNLLAIENSKQLERISDCVEEIQEIKYDIRTSTKLLAEKQGDTNNLLEKYSRHTQRTLDICVELLNVIKYSDTKSSSMKIIDKSDNILDVLRTLHADVQVIKDRAVRMDKKK